MIQSRSTVIISFHRIDIIYWKKGSKHVFSTHVPISNTHTYNTNAIVICFKFHTNSRSDKVHTDRPLKAIGRVFTDFFSHLINSRRKIFLKNVLWFTNIRKMLFLFASEKGYIGVWISKFCKYIYNLLYYS